AFLAAAGGRAVDVAGPARICLHDRVAGGGHPTPRPRAPAREPGREVAVPERRQHLEQPGLVDAIGGLLLLSLRGGRRQRYSARSVRRSLGSSGGRAAGESIVSHVTSLPRPTRANATGRASQDRVAAGGADLAPKSRRGGAA